MTVRKDIDEITVMKAPVHRFNPWIEDTEYWKDWWAILAHLKPLEQSEGHDEGASTMPDLPGLEDLPQWPDHTTANHTAASNTSRVSDNR